MKTKNVLILYLVSKALLLYTINISSSPLMEPVAEQLDPIQEAFQFYPSSISSHADSIVISNFNISLGNFITERYNSPTYAEYLSQNGDDVCDLLSIVKKTSALKDDRLTYSYTILKLMHEKLKSWKCKLIDDSVVHQILSHLPFVLKEYFVHDSAYISKEIQRAHMVQINAFLRSYKKNQSLDLIKKSYKALPAQFTSLCDSFREQALSWNESRNELSALVLRITELMLSKITWNRSSYESIWPSVIKIANDISLINKTIWKNEDYLDSARWSLTHGFCNYLGLVGACLPVNFYTSIYNDLNEGVISFLEEEEQDDFITSKKETFIECLVHAETQARAFSKGTFVPEFASL